MQDACLDAGMSLAAFKMSKPPSFPPVSLAVDREVEQCTRGRSGWPNEMPPLKLCEQQLNLQSMVRAVGCKNKLDGARR
ncbi:hypothetical protein O181_055821 [Austropuccinia psidii MF-1]|uniref:Uncharacterized protein n=1 Tax=Austropuccinia psidii MF-1 TaxID=1389203 RepID=A0A9Q3E574_9BASI|nr:hypothetical protein [Austropuccinia psidii MF-1]